jgi:peroxiredoxin
MTVLGLACTGCAGPTTGAAAAGSPSPTFRLTAQDGQVIESGKLKGQIVVLNFWSTTCGPCLREMPHLQEVSNSGRATVIGVAIDPGGWAAVRPFIEKNNIRFTIAVGDQELFEMFDGYRLPHTVVLDRGQRVVKMFRWVVTQEQLEKEIAGIEQGDRAGAYLAGP